MVAIGVEKCFDKGPVMQWLNSSSICVPPPVHRRTYIVVTHYYVDAWTSSWWLASCRMNIQWLIVCLQQTRLVEQGDRLINWLMTRSDLSFLLLTLHPTISSFYSLGHFSYPSVNLCNTYSSKSLGNCVFATSLEEVDGVVFKETQSDTQPKNWIKTRSMNRMISLTLCSCGVTVSVHSSHASFPPLLLFCLDKSLSHPLYGNKVNRSANIIWLPNIQPSLYSATKQSFTVILNDLLANKWIGAV